MSKRSIAIAAIAIGLIGMTAYAVVHSAKPSNAGVESNSSLGEEGPVTFQDNSDLSEILLSQQYNSFTFTVSDFIHQKIDTRINKAVVQAARVQPNGLVNAQIETDQPKQAAFSVSIDRSQYNQLTITIAAYNYSKTVQVY